MRRAERLLGWVVLTACAAFGTAVMAATPEPGAVVYVTDELRLGLYATEETTDRPRRTLTSGSRLTVLERSLRSIRVRTDDGAEGWVKTAYVVTAEPARSRLAKAEKAHAAAVASLAERDEELATARQRLAELTTSLNDLEDRHGNLPALEADNLALRAALTEDAATRLIWLARP